MKIVCMLWGCINKKDMDILDKVNGFIGYIILSLQDTTQVIIYLTMTV